jgi:NAD(P)H-flavin reductase
MLTAPDAVTASLMAPQWCPVVDRWEETHDTFSIVLEAPDGFSFRPGQFNMLYTFGTGESAISISGDPAEPERLMHTIRRVGKVTEALGALRPGDHVGLRGPFGIPWPLGYSVGRDVVVVAGGIGIAPLRPAVREILANRDRYEQVAVLIGTRSPRDLPFIEEIQDWRGHFDLDVEVTVDSAPTSWRGRVGVVTTLIPVANVDYSKAVALVCGPEIMMRFTAAELMKRGMPASRIFVSMERNMKCGVGRCGHCQFGPHFVCTEGPVFAYDVVERLLDIREV